MKLVWPLQAGKQTLSSWYKKNLWEIVLETQRLWKGPTPHEPVPKHL